MELAKAIARDPKVVLVDEPFAGLTSAEVANFSALIAGFRAEGRAVLLVDHNVKGVAALVDRVLAMYLGERVAEGTAAEVMAHPTGARGLSRSGSMEPRGPAPKAASERRAAAAGPRTSSVLYGKAQALEGVSLHVHEGEFVSIVGLNGAGKTTLFNAISGLVPLYRATSCCGRDAGAAAPPAAIARERHRAVPGKPRAVRRHVACGRTWTLAASS